MASRASRSRQSEWILQRSSEPCRSSVRSKPSGKLPCSSSLKRATRRSGRSLATLALTTVSTGDDIARIIVASWILGPGDAPICRCAASVRSRWVPAKCAPVGLSFGRDTLTPDGVRARRARPSLAAVWPHAPTAPKPLPICHVGWRRKSRFQATPRLTNRACSFIFLGGGIVRRARSDDPDAAAHRRRVVDEKLRNTRRLARWLDQDGVLDPAWTVITASDSSSHSSPPTS